MSQKTNPKSLRLQKTNQNFSFPLFADFFWSENYQSLVEIEKATAAFLRENNYSKAFLSLAPSYKKVWLFSWIQDNRADKKIKTLILNPLSKQDKRPAFSVKAQRKKKAKQRNPNESREEKVVLQFLEAQQREKKIPFFYEGFTSAKLQEAYEKSFPQANLMKPLTNEIRKTSKSVPFADIRLKEFPQAKLVKQEFRKPKINEEERKARRSILNDFFSCFIPHFHPYLVSQATLVSRTMPVNTCETTTISTSQASFSKADVKEACETSDKIQSSFRKAIVQHFLKKRKSSFTSFACEANTSTKLLQTLFVRLHQQACDARETKVFSKISTVKSKSSTVLQRIFSGWRSLNRSASPILQRKEALETNFLQASGSAKLTDNLVIDFTKESRFAKAFPQASFTSAKLKEVCDVDEKRVASPLQAKLVAERINFAPFKESVDHSLYKKKASPFFLTTLSVQPLRFINDHQHVTSLLDPIIFLIKQRVAWRKIKSFLFKHLSRNSQIKGMRITCSGRLGGRSKKAQKAKMQSDSFGETSLSVLSSALLFGSKNAYTPYGLVGVKIWLCFQSGYRTTG